MKTSTSSARALLNVFRDKRNILILTHDNPDPDAIASGMAMQTLLRARLNKQSTLAFGGIIGRAENKALVDILHVELSPISEIEFHNYDAVALIDSQPEAGNHSLPADITPTVVIDHHFPALAATRRVPFADVRPDHGACSTILVDYLRRLHVPIDARLATALFYGIKVDTQDLGRHASPADVDAYMYLFPLTEKLLLPKIDYPPLPPVYFETFHAAFERAIVFGGKVVISALDEADNPNVVAEVADLLLRLEGAVWSLCLGFYDDQLFVSVRTADPEANAHDVVRMAIGSAGSGGGHGMLAGGRIAVAKLSHRERLRVRADLVARLLQVLGMPQANPAPLLRPKERRLGR